ncbi:MAG: GTPase HflX [Lachnospiraceae bacterium]|nr:GTPase HflX [Lachnospiraceae bacterium]
MHENAEVHEKLILIGVETGSSSEMTRSLDELSDLVSTAGAETVGRVIQNRERIHPGTYIGKGKIEEVKDLLWETEATGVVCDDELTPAQMKNLEDALDTKVLDRTVLILDIFASRAVTKEGRIQVELAQSRYALTRLQGFGRSMSRLGGGIGTRGPGETKLETDRRRIRTRISQLKTELSEVERKRALNRSLREKNHVPVVAIVGYTNAGKSTLLNRLTEAGVLSENKLFATLDPTTRSLRLPSGQVVLLTDTVGFIRKLPHHLIDAFRSTLEEARYADLITHVVDASNPDRDAQIGVVYETLRNLGVTGKPIITLFNKCDLLPENGPILRDERAERSIQTSMVTGEGIERFLSEIERLLNEGNVYLEQLFSFQDAGKIQTIRKYGRLLEEKYTEEGIFVRAYVPKSMIPKNEEDDEF